MPADMKSFRKAAEQSAEQRRLDAQQHEEAVCASALVVSQHLSRREINFDLLKSAMVRLARITTGEDSSATHNLLRGIGRLPSDDRVGAIAFTAKLVETTRPGTTLSQQLIERWQDFMLSGPSPVCPENYDLAAQTFADTKNLVLKLAAAKEMCENARLFLQFTTARHPQILQDMQEVSLFAKEENARDVYKASKRVDQDLRRWRNSIGGPSGAPS